MVRPKNKPTFVDRLKVIREHAIASGMRLLTVDDILEEKQRRRIGDNHEDEQGQTD